MITDHYTLIGTRITAHCTTTHRTQAAHVYGAGHLHGVPVLYVAWDAIYPAEPSKRPKTWKDTIPLSAVETITPATTEVAA